MKFGYFDYCLILTFSFSIGLQLQLSSNVRLAYISSFCFYLQLSCIAAFVLARLHSYIVKDPPSHIEVERNVSSSSAFFSNNTVDVIQLTEVPMVVDFGSHSTKVGFAGADAPIKIIAPSADNQIAGWGAKMESIWEQLYDESDNICKKTERQKFSSVCPLILSWHPSYTPEDAEVLIETLFEKYHVPAVYLSPSPVLSLYANGMTTGCVLECGHNASLSCSVIDGHLLPSSLCKTSKSGSTLNKNIMARLQTMELLHSSGSWNVDLAKRLHYSCVTTKDSILSHGDTDSIGPWTSSKMDIERRDLSEDEDDVIGSFAVPRPLQECLYASQNFLFSSDQPSIDCGASLAGFHSPARRDQNRHSKSPKKAQPEKLQSAFPVQMDAVVGHDAQCLPVQDCVYQSILSTSRGWHEKLWKSIVVSGGTSGSQHFTDRLLWELKPISQREGFTMDIVNRHVKGDCAVRLINGANYHDNELSVWQGGSVIGSMSTPSVHWLRRSEYLEHGGYQDTLKSWSTSNHYVHSKCQTSFDVQ